MHRYVDTNICWIYTIYKGTFVVKDGHCTCVTLSSACVRRNSAAALSARSCARSSSCDVVIVVRPNVVFSYLIGAKRETEKLVYSKKEGDYI